MSDQTYERCPLASPCINFPYLKSIIPTFQLSSGFMEADKLIGIYWAFNYARAHITGQFSLEVFADFYDCRNFWRHVYYLQQPEITFSVGQVLFLFLCPVYFRFLLFFFFFAIFMPILTPTWSVIVHS